MRATLVTLALLLAACANTRSLRAQPLGGTAPDALPGSLLEEAPGLELPSNTTEEQGAVTPGLLPSSDSSEAARRGAADSSAETSAEPAPRERSTRPSTTTRTAPVPRTTNQSRADLPPPPTGSADDAWRFKWHDELWWYWTPDKTWRILQAGRWVPYQKGAYYARESAGMQSQGAFTESTPAYSSTIVNGATNYSSGNVATYTLGPRRWAMGYRGVGPAYRSYGYGRYSLPTYYPGYGRTFGYGGGYYGGYSPGYGGSYGPGYGGDYYGSPGAAIGGAIGSSIGGWGGGGIGAGIGTGFGRGW